MLAVEEFGGRGAIVAIIVLAGKVTVCAGYDRTDVMAGITQYGDPINLMTRV